MPPFVPRKRSHSPAPQHEPPRKRPAAPPKPPAKRKPASRPKTSVFAAVDTPQARGRTVKDNEAFLAHQTQDQSSDCSSGDSSSSDEFEDVLPDDAGPSGATGPNTHNTNSDDEDEVASNGSATWADLLPSAPTPAAPSGDLQLTLPRANETIDYSQWAAARETTGKKGPSKIERQIRIATHCMHVQFLLFHNLVRNSWAQDQEVKDILLGRLNEGCWREIVRWREAVGLPEMKKDGTVVNDTNAELEKSRKAGSSAKKSEMRKAKGKGKGKEKDTRVEDERSHRDWSHTATRESGNPEHDPLPRLLTYLASFWKKNFKSTAPSLRKIGYLEPAALQSHMRAYRKDKKSIDRFGERITSLKEFRNAARKGMGSRDVGQQLFTGLLRALGIEARMVSSLQPVGFGWSKGEEGKVKTSSGSGVAENEEDEDPDAMEMDESQDQDSGVVQSNASPAKGTKTPSSKRISTKITARKPGRGSKAAPIDLGSDSSELSDPPSDSDSDLSIVDLTPSKPISKAPKGYSQTHPFPTYWTEAFSPKTHVPHAVSPLTAPYIASTAEAFQAFEPRGKDADKAKQVFAYVVAFSSDGTAKDVTVRYLKRRMWPGKTKGVRMPVEKVPIYNKRGKVKRYEEYDWFKSVMSAYARDSRHRNEIDDIEDTGDLVPVKPTKKENSENLDTLSGLKASADFVLERFLRREEALLPNSKPVRTFTSGKGEKAKTEPVYRRCDLVNCKTVESWHKEGRELLPGEQALKRVPHRAVTLIRKQEIADQERETGEKPLQGLYSKAQTQWIIPPPIENGRIPRNAFGNIDVYVPSMVPRGAVHLPLRGTVKICKKLGIDFAEACVGFEFGAQRAVPVLHGVVVAEENKALVRDAWRTEQEAQKKKEETKREVRALTLWKKFLVGLRIVERVTAEYGKGADGVDLNPFVNKQAREKATNKQKEDTYVAPADEEDGGFMKHDEEMAGGFFLPGRVEEESKPSRSIAAHEGITMDDEAMLEDGTPLDLSDDEGGGGFILEDDDPNSASPDTSKQIDYPRTPISLQSAHQNLVSTMVGSKMDNGVDVVAKDNENNEDSLNSTKSATSKSRNATSIQARNTLISSAARKSRTSTAKRKKTKAMILDDEDEISDQDSELSSHLSVSEAGSDSSPSDADDDDFALQTPRSARARPKTNATLKLNNGPVRRSTRTSTGTGMKSKYFDDD